MYGNDLAKHEPCFDFGAGGILELHDLGDAALEIHRTLRHSRGTDECRGRRCQSRKLELIYIGWNARTARVHLFRQ